MPDIELPLTLSERSGVPFYRQIEDQIAELIRSAQVAPGAPLPSVRGLAAQLRVSVITTRRAYDELVRDGLVVRRQGQGSSVAPNIGASSLARARRRARQVLTDAIVLARQLGLTDVEQRALLDDLLDDRRGGDDGTG